MSRVSSRITLQDVAREAGVSLATADRVLNGRAGVREATAGRVRDVVARLGYRPNAAAARLARGETYRFCFVLPSGPNVFMRQLAEQVTNTAEWLSTHNAFIDLLRVDVFAPEALAATLEGLIGRYDGVAVVALDHPRVRSAIDDLTAAGMVVVTLVSDVPSSHRRHYVGVDNIAAGRTAGTLIGRFAGGRQGAVGLIVGTPALRDHAERQFGFTQVLSGEYPSLKVLPVQESLDEDHRTQEIVEQMLREVPDLVGLYNVGAGNGGIAAALAAFGRAGELVFVGHDLTDDTRRFLLRGVMDAVINQDAGHQSRSAARVLLAHCSGEPLFDEQERIRIDIFVRDNLP
ncbi:LacI family DNA-binding transcriptional regulator [Ancylobacter defluvii]|uniref:Transcriptional regulator n=1 Tax=Ancylobacter defluvii TaxID=1282440 RepID=A0A9W6K0P3_9HYPH|nr:LacI family DNA-binding transcriptional regulator [Ancylobacter defluvii]MBS7588348.1 substrate-binding domain-containing protein [Ancylobacter defluvii]GLK86752.1 transcriptional regulator [Ancylobacter defluvii]